MKTYFAVIKLKKQPTAFKMSFTESDTGAAIDKMLSIAGVSSSSEEVEEYEIYHVLDDKVAYVPVARKNKQQSTALTVVEKKVDQPTYTEKVYISYKDVA